MNERELSEKLSKVVNLAQEKIITLLSDYSNNSSIEKVKSVFLNCPIELESIDEIKNEFNKSNQVGGYATRDKIVISRKDVEKFDLNTQQELDNMLGTIIHEYAHKFRQVDSEYGNMFEEASATIFAEMCVNYSKIKNNEPNNELFNMLTSVDYQKAESQVRAILYALKQRNMDISMMTEYILGDEERFKQICTQIFGSSFDDYFNKANNISKEQQYMNVSEDSIIQIMTDYIKNNQISLKDYWSTNKNIVSSNNLYFSGSSVLAQSVVNAGIQNIREDEKDLYKYFEYDVKVNREQSEFISDEKRTRIRNKINQDINLSGKSKEEIYDRLIDLCSDYIQHKSKDDEESKIYLDELNKIVPNIDQFSENFKRLRVSRLDNSLLDNMDLSNISYKDISLKMDSLISSIEIEKKKEELIKQKEELLALKQSQLDNGFSLKLNKGFANVVLISIITLLFSLFLGLLIFKIIN